MKDSIEAVKSFVEKVTGKYKEIVKAIWLIKEGKQHTLLMLLDDTRGLDEASLRMIKLEAPAIAAGVEKEKGVLMDVNFYMLTDYWELLRHGSPVTFAEIREGLPVYDPSGFFIPMKKLLAQGRIPGTKEAMRSLLEEAPLKLLRIERFFMFKIIDELAMAVIDAGQAPLLLIGVTPPIPKELPEKLRTHFVEKGMLEAEYARYAEEMVRLMKGIEHGEKKSVEPKEIEEAMEKTGRFVERMEKLMQALSKA
ncbi:MAG: hypothetical protein QXU82_01510 [Candidatus Aenigmatarchaeota archaeon]